MPKCKICDKSVYPMDPQINLDGEIFHNTCAKCQDCKCQITLSNFVKNTSPDTTLLLCKIHYMKRFKEGGMNMIKFEFLIITKIFYFISPTLQIIDINLFNWRTIYWRREVWKEDRNRKTRPEYCWIYYTGEFNCGLSFSFARTRFIPSGIREWDETKIFCCA